MAEKEYIDKVAFNYAIREAVKKYPNSFYNGLKVARQIAHDFPAADVRPVVRGKWLNDFCGKGRFSKRIVQCSLCGNFLDLDGVNAGRGDANYCPNCGADMRQTGDENV